MTNFDKDYTFMGINIGKYYKKCLPQSRCIPSFAILRGSLISKLHLGCTFRFYKKLRRDVLSDLIRESASQSWSTSRQHRCAHTLKRARVNTRSKSGPMGETRRCGCNLLAVPCGKWRGVVMTTDSSKANDSALRHESLEQSLIGALKGDGDTVGVSVIFLL